MRINVADLDDPEVLEMLRTHVRLARAQTALGSAHALDEVALRSASIEVWMIRDGLALVAVGALQRLSPDHAEIKSMHSVASARRKGAGNAMLIHIVGAARAHGMTRLSLETGVLGLFSSGPRTVSQPWLYRVRAVWCVCPRCQQCVHVARPASRMTVLVLRYEHYL